jgi:hypothetical protein
VNNETIMQFHLLLGDETWGIYLQRQRYQQQFSSFLYIFLHIFEANFPIKYKNTDKIQRIWITQGIKTSFKLQRRLHIHSRKSNGRNKREFYTKYCKILNNVTEAKKKHYSTLIEKSDNEIK